jgi:hypothetical protein
MLVRGLFRFDRRQFRLEWGRTPAAVVEAVSIRSAKPQTQKTGPRFLLLLRGDRGPYDHELVGRCPRVVIPA